MRVSLISHAYSELGLRRQIRVLAQYVDITLIAPSRATTLMWKNYRPQSTQDDPVTRFRRISLFGQQFLLATPTFHFRRARPDVIHIDYDPWSAIFWQARLIAACLTPRARIVIGAKKNTYRRYSGLVGRIKLTLAMRGLASVHHIVAASQMTANMYTAQFSVPGGRISVATHVGVDIDAFSPAEPKADTAAPLHIGYVGLLSAHKGVEDLVEAVRAVRQQGLDVRLSLLGAGDLTSPLVQLSHEEQWLSIRGPVPSDDVAPFLRELDIYVLPARILPDHQEHDAHALLQALACGLPAIGTRSGIIPEVLAPDVGILVRPAARDELADAIALLSRDPSLRQRLGRAARRLATARYSLESVARAKAEIYERVLSESEG